MRYTLKLNGVVVGWSDLEEIEPSVGRAHGPFRAGVGYELVEPVFRLFAEAVPRSTPRERDEAKLQRYYRSRDALPLELFDATGRRIPTSAIHIADYASQNGNVEGEENEGKAERELDVLIPDEGYWRRRLAATC